MLNVYKIIPPKTVRVPSRDKLFDAQINIQACIANVYGCIDNLAWVWVYEKDLDKKIQRNRVGLRNSNAQVRASLRPAFRTYLEARDDWMEYLVDFRDALAHRIPLYIPPGVIPRSPGWLSLSGRSGRHSLSVGEASRRICRSGRHDGDGAAKSYGVSKAIDPLAIGRWIDRG